MRLLLLLLPGLLLHANQALGQSETFQLEYDMSTGSAWDNDIEQYPDDSYISVTQASASTGVFVARFADDGTHIWAKYYNGSHSEVAITPDGGAILSGTRVTKLNAAGAVEWTKVFPETVVGSTTTSDGHVVCITDNYIFKVDQSGNLLWARDASNWTPEHITEIASGGVVVVGLLSSTDMAIVKVDNAGNIVWQRQIGISNNSSIVGIDERFDGHIWVGQYYISGYVWNTVGNDQNQPQVSLQLYRFDGAGVAQYYTSTSVGPYAYYYNGIACTSSGKIVLTGREYERYSIMQSMHETSLFTANSAGTALNRQDINGPWPYCADIRGPKPTSDGGVIVGASYFSVCTYGASNLPVITKLDHTLNHCASNSIANSSSTQSSFTPTIGNAVLTASTAVLSTASNLSVSNEAPPQNICSNTVSAGCNPPIISASNIGITTATINWNTISNVQLYHVEVQDPAGNITTYPNQSGGTLALTGLASNSTYQYKATAICTDNGVVESNWNSFTTNIYIPPCDPPTSVFSSGIGPGTATLHWDTVSGASEYFIRLSLGGPTIASYTVQHPDSQLIVNNLAADTTWYFQVRAHCTTGLWSQATSVDSFVVSPVPAPLGCGSPSNVTSTLTTLSGITVHWDTVASATGYQLRYRALNGLDTDTLILSSVPDSIHLEPLQVCANYEWSVRAICGTQNPTYGAWTALDTIATNCVVPKSEVSADAQLTQSINVHAFPNPASTSLTIVCATEHSIPIEVALYNSLGQVLSNKTMRGNSNSTMRLDLSDLSPGYYVLEGRSDLGRCRTHVLISR